MSDKEQLEEELAEKGSRYLQLKEMVATQGWKIVKQYIDEQMKSAQEAVMARDVEAEETYKIRALYYAYQRLLDFVYKENIELLKEELDK